MFFLLFLTPSVLGDVASHDQFGIFFSLPLDSLFIYNYDFIVMKFPKRHPLKKNTVWYECSPYCYILVAILAMFNSASVVAILCSLVLLLAAVKIVHMRWKYRSSPMI